MKILAFRAPLPSWNGLPLAGRIWIHPREWWNALDTLSAWRAGAACDIPSAGSRNPQREGSDRCGVRVGRQTSESGLQPTLLERE